MEIKFMPGCFDEFEGTQEELDELVAELQRLVKTGELEEYSRELTEDECLELGLEKEKLQ